jgi:hypothetical protein
VLADSYTEGCIGSNPGGIQPVVSPAGSYRINVGSNGPWELDIQAAG